MPPRYQQGQLQSPVTGTPGIDQSAGVAEQQIAQSSQQMHQAEQALSMQNLQQAEQSFLQSRNMFYNYAQQQAAQQRADAAIAKAKADEQRRLQAQFDRIDEDGRLDSVITDLKTRYADSPMKAVEDFKSQIPVLRQAFQDRHSDDQQKLRMLMPSQRQQEIGALSDLQTWASRTTTQNLNTRLQLMPVEIEDKINKLSGTWDQQVIGYQKAIDGANQIYGDLHNKALTQADRNEISMKMLQLNQGAGKQFVDHMMSQAPAGEEGIKFLDSLHGSVKVAEMFGVALNGDDKNTVLSKIQSQRNALEQDVIVGIKSDNDLNILDAKQLKFKLYQAANDPTQMHEIAGQVQDRYSDLEKQIAQVSKDPDSKIKNAKLAGLKQQQETLISELGLDVKMVRSFEQLQRTLTSFAQGQLRFQQSQLTFQQGQLRFAQGQEDRVKKLELENANNKLAESKGEFNREWGSTLNKLNQVFALPSGSKQQEAVSKVINEAQPLLDKALASGVITGTSYGSYIKQLKESNQAAGLKPQAKAGFQIGSFTIGGSSGAPLKGAEKQKAIDKSDADVANVLAAHQDNFRALNEAVNQLSALTAGKAERAILTEYVTANMPSLLNSKGYKKLSPADQAKQRAAAVRSAVQLYREGKLK
ncbi:MAG: hypothetical protein K2X27_15950 [Candidatus Obscuribacterales bacterium]|nr:hypothetical protein [Candidatus Obscuribacterales bacterium]